MYRVTHNTVPQYIADLIPNLVGEETQYPLRNHGDIRIPYCRTSLSQNSCIPSSIGLWNTMSHDTRNLNSLNSFRHALKRRHEPFVNAPYFSIGKRVLSVMHARIRNNCSDLYNDLYTNHLRDDPICSCAVSEPEDAEHYFFR